MTNKREPFVYAEGDLVRLENRPARVKQINLAKGTVTLWTDYGMRTCFGYQLTPAKPGDVLMPTPAEYRVRRRAGKR